MANETPKTEAPKSDKKKYTIQNGGVRTNKDPSDPKSEQIRLKVGDEIELTPAMAKKMDPEGHYLVLSSKFRKKAELDDDELDEITKPPSKPDPKK